MRTILPLLLLLAAFEAAAADIRNLHAQEQDGRISVSFELGGGFDAPDIQRSLRSGVPTGFSYQIQLIRKRPNWFDTHVTDTRIDAVASYNSVTGEYLLNFRRDRRLVRSEIVSSFPELVRKMSTIREPELFGLNGYRATKLRVRVRGEIIRDWLLYLVPNPVRTEWEETRVRPASTP